jgi:hypothetical protein
MMFNIVAEVLTVMMTKATGKGMVKGVMSHIISEGITHIQYAYDIVLMIEGDVGSIINMKFILYCFEWLLGLKINYHKSEAFVFGMDENEKSRVANMLNCQLGELPIKYLGIPLSDRKIRSEDMRWLPDKISKRVPPWKGKQMSSRARLILTNSCLSSLPTYVMGFYLLT